MGPTIGFMELTPTGNCTITGIPAGIDGQLLIITNLASGFTVTLLALNASSTAANQFRMATGILLEQYDSQAFKYSVSIGKWVAVVDAWGGINQNVQTTNYTLVLSDANSLISMNGASLTATIPANATVAFAPGTMQTFDNQNASNLSIAIAGGDTLILAGTTTTGTRTLARNGTATAVKTGATTWKISGAGLT